VSSKGGNSSLVHGGSRMDKLKVACIFAKVEIVIYVSNVYSSVTVGLEW
jgi:hypothetical protein